MTNSFNLKVTGAAVAFALAAITGTANAGVPGYVADTQNQIWTSPYGLCWKTTDWGPEKAAAPCDAVRRVEAPVPPPVAVAPPPAPAPAPTPLVVAPPAPPPIIEQISLSSDVLFEFNKAELRPAGQQKLDEIADRLKGANVQQIAAIGHADRIGSDDYNKQLSEKRAEAVKQYLTQKGVEQTKVRSEGRGESEPVTGDNCKGNKPNAKLIACLQPDRRVDIEVRGERQVAGTPAPSGSAGATGGSSGGASSSSNSTNAVRPIGTGSSGSSANPSSPSSTGAMGNSPSAPGSTSSTPGTAK
jgi:OmpA-OmpF porin, OOP family